MFLALISEIMFKTTGIKLSYLSLRKPFLASECREYNADWKLWLNEYSQCSCLVYLTYMLFLIPIKKQIWMRFIKVVIKYVSPTGPKFLFKHITLVCQENISTKGHLGSVGWGGVEEFGGGGGGGGGGWLSWNTFNFAFKPEMRKRIQVRYTRHTHWLHTAWLHTFHHNLQSVLCSRHSDARNISQRGM